VGTDDGPRCVCGKHGCLEAWLAVPRLLDAIDDASSSDDSDVGREAGRALILREAGRRLGIVLALVVAALDLGEVVLSGPVELLDGELMTSAAETLRARIAAEYTAEVILRMTSHGQDIVIRGAAVMVLSRQLGVS
jgi:predicted NBD/HSP70 family sugar kinase